MIRDAGVSRRKIEAVLASISRRTRSCGLSIQNSSLLSSSAACLSPAAFRVRYDPVPSTRSAASRRFAWARRPMRRGRRNTATVSYACSKYETGPEPGYWGRLVRSDRGTSGARRRASHAPRDAMRTALRRSSHLPHCLRRAARTRVSRSGLLGDERDRRADRASLSDGTKTTGDVVVEDERIECRTGSSSR